MVEKRNIIIIPARGGSKRLPQKNILQLKKKPLLCYSIDYAKKNKEIADKIVVSTDDSQIKELALSKGIEVIDRPKSLSGDKATTVSALRHVLESIDSQFDNVILLQVTNPLRPVNMLKEAYETYIEKGSDSLMGVSRNNDKLGKIIDNRYVPFNYEIGQRSQDLEPLYYENGLLYITKSDLILQDKILGNKNFPFVVDHPFAKVDIDTIEDFKYAEFVIENYKDE